MAVITISRQMGSFGSEVASEIAGCLKYRVVWREVINQAALRAGVPEVALATIDELDLLGIRPSTASRNSYHKAVREVMEELWREGNVVIVGRAGQAILRGKVNVLHVKIFAPIEIRVQRVAEKFKISNETARVQIEASDLTRTRYLKKYYQMRWDDPGLYDIMINTEKLSTKCAALIVCEAMKQFPVEI